MAGFAVDTDAVKTFAQQLSQVCADLGAASLPSDLGDAETGSKDVTGALERFHAHWKDGQDKLLASLTALRTAIGDAGDAYQQADGAVSSATSGQ